MVTLPEQLKKHWISHSDALRELEMSRSTFHRKRLLGLFETDTYNSRMIVKKTSVARYLNTFLRQVASTAATS